MAEAVIIQALVQLPLRKAGSLAADEFSLLWGFKKDLAKLERSLEMVHGFLHDVQRGPEANDRAIKVWLRNLEDVAYDADNILDDFNYEVLRRKIEIRNQMTRKVRFFFSLSNPVLFRFKMAHKVQEINNRLRAINKEAKAFGLQSRMALADNPLVLPAGAVTVDRETDSFHSASDIIGREKDTSGIVELLMTPRDEAISVIPILGMGGIGKTTLAQKIFNDPQIKGRFDKRIWTCISDNNFHVTKLFDLILESLNKKRPEADTREAKGKIIQEELQGKKYLLVLDDVWDDEKHFIWTDFLKSLNAMSTARGSFMLVTTRKQEVASMVGTFPPFVVSKLSPDNCWLILTKTACGSREIAQELQDRKDEIAEKCGGLPLLASVLGGMLRNKGIDEWVSVLKNMHQHLRENDDVLQILKVSFNHLPSPACKNCFAYCSIFPKDYYMRREEIISLWMAEGFLEGNAQTKKEMEEIGNEIFNILLRSNLLQDLSMHNAGTWCCKMHDLVHDLAQSVLRSNAVSEEQTRGRDFDRVHYPGARRSIEGIEYLLSNEARRVLPLFSQNKISNSSMSRFRRLRILKLSWSNAEELPWSIGKLRQIRYLDISYSKINALPRSLCKLYHLQTLRARNCTQLKKFPDDFKNLMSLRHFDYFTSDISSTSMPIEMRHLSNLRTLPFYNIGAEKGRQIDELKGLKNLCGSLEIRNLELVNGKCGAESANLNLEELCLESCPDLACIVPEIRSLGDSLKSLEIRNCPVFIQLPNDLHSLHSLRSFIIDSCPNLQSIPIPRGPERLTSLRDLEICGCHGLIHLPSEMLEPSILSSMEYLKVANCSNLQSSLPIDFHQIQMPSLREFRLAGCPKLSSMPSLAGIGCLVRLSDLSIGPSENTDFEYFRDHVLDGLHDPPSSLGSLTLYGRADWDSLPDQLQNLSALWSLSLYDFGIEALPDWLGNLSSLGSIHFYNCEKLQYLPSIKVIRRLTKLRQLYVRNCPLFEEGFINQQSGPDSERSKISHISIFINGIRKQRANRL